MNVLLRPELEQFIDEKIKAGQYADPSEMVNNALEMLRAQEEFTPDQEAYLAREVRRGIEQLDRGERASFTAEQIIAQERQRMTGRKGLS